MSTPELNGSRQHTKGLSFAPRSPTTGVF